MTEPSKKDVREQHLRILAHKSFSSSPRSSKLFTYLVETALSGQTRLIKGYTIAVDVFDKPDDFEPRIDSIVRVQTGRLRKKLELYYLTDGQEDSVYIDLPNGSYVPIFSVKASVAADNSDRKTPLEWAKNLVVDHVPPSARAHKVKPLLVISTLALMAVTFTSSFMVLSNRSSEANVLDYDTAIQNGPSLTIFAFDALSMEAENNGIDTAELLKVGLEHELLGNLSRFKDLQVVSHQSPLARSTEASQLGEKARTDFHLNGSVQTTADTVRVTSRLSRADTNVVIWSKTYNEVYSSSSCIMKIQSTIAADVATALGQPYSVVNKHLQYMNANERDVDHHYCLVGFYKYLESKSEADHKKVRDCLEASVQEDADFSSGWAALSWIYGDEARNNFNPRASAPNPLDDAIKAAKKAIEADPENAMGYQYLSLAAFANGDFIEFREAAELAIKLNPNDPEVLADVGSHLVILDNSDQARLMVEKAIALNPQHPPWYHGSILFYFYDRELSEKALYHAGQYSADNSIASNAMLTATQVQADRIDEARKNFADLIENHPEFATDYESIIGSWQVKPALKARIIKDLMVAGLDAS